ncbi:helix-turn-helix transcriptional regulator [Metabacillus sp. FJAT-53654]|uniref:Helix-turn-helix transcriptional regulator n=1 Tax=Metabacillus rhizosphaerae TaxID=3117747 RepID=A0ABZ2MYK5_9BACI
MRQLDNFSKELITIEEFSEFVNHMRSSIGLTKREFADAMGVTKSTVINWENAATIPNNVHAIIRTMRIVVKLRIRNSRLIA